MPPISTAMRQRWQRKPLSFFRKQEQWPMPSEPKRAEVLNTAFRCRGWRKKPPKHYKLSSTAVREAKKRGRFDLALRPQAIQQPYERGVCPYLETSPPRGVPRKNDGVTFRNRTRPRPQQSGPRPRSSPTNTRLSARRSFCHGMHGKTRNFLDFHG